MVEPLLEWIVLHVPRGIDVLGVTRAAQRLERVDVRLERQRRVEYLLDACLAVVLDGLTYLPCMRSRLLHDLVADLLLTPFEQRIVLREVCVAENVRRDERVLLQRVVAREIRSARIAGE